MVTRIVIKQIEFKLLQSNSSLDVNDNKLVPITLNTYLTNLG
jgi:hypothetical protein